MYIDRYHFAFAYNNKTRFGMRETRRRSIEKGRAQCNSCHVTTSCSQLSDKPPLPHLPRRRRDADGRASPSVPENNPVKPQIPLFPPIYLLYISQLKSRLSNIDLLVEPTFHNAIVWPRNV